MTLTEAIERIERIPTYRWDELSLHIVTHAPGFVGDTPGVGVRLIGAGIDWDGNKLLLHPDKPLTTLTPESVEAIMTSVRAGGSWHAYQQYKRLTTRIAELERELQGRP